MNYISRCFLLLSMFFAFNVLATGVGTSQVPQGGDIPSFGKPVGEREYWLFVGNPGAGKSTLINALKKRTVAAAGVSPGSGLTKYFTSYEDLQNNRVYLDTPGLADTKMRLEAAQQIEEALKQNGKYKIFFILNFNAGRVKAEDLATLNTVMDAVNLSHKPFSIIINKLEDDEKEMLENENNRAMVFGELNRGNNKTQSVYYIARSSKLKKKKIEFLDLSDELYAFFNTREAIHINKEEIAEVKTDDLEKITKVLEGQMQQMREEFAADKKAQQALIASLQAAASTMQQQLTEAKNRAEAAERNSSSKKDEGCNLL